MGLIVQSVCPFFVCTKLLPLEPSLTVPRPEEFVESAFKTVGSQPVTNGSLVHNIMVNFVGLILFKILVVNLYCLYRDGFAKMRFPYRSTIYWRPGRFKK